MLHRALLGSIERFFGMLIEHYAGALPLWLSPVQAVVIPIVDASLDFARDTVYRYLREQGLRVEIDERSEKMQAKIRDAQLQKIPYMVVIGGREKQAGTLAIRHRQKGDLGPMTLDDFANRVKKETADRTAG